ncbi:hypothetical protein CTRI78_v007031 [Colletotrichum trifolii]|uniref:Uncharacterized protein n=1 Tax=Colletotrichum trifolii TaxID=5466 RepID=A0A4R8REK7_COLTR|nr:hypothetical protein CTRI78_v007031 [Colletotrichum trifolii]
MMGDGASDPCPEEASNRFMTYDVLRIIVSLVIDDALNETMLQPVYWMPAKRLKKVKPTTRLDAEFAQGPFLTAKAQPAGAKAYRSLQRQRFERFRSISQTNQDSRALALACFHFVSLSHESYGFERQGWVCPRADFLVFTLTGPPAPEIARAMRLSPTMQLFENLRLVQDLSVPISLSVATPVLHALPHLRTVSFRRTGTIPTQPTVSIVEPGSPAQWSHEMLSYLAERGVRVSAYDEEMMAADFEVTGLPGGGFRLSSGEAQDSIQFHVVSRYRGPLPSTFGDTSETQWWTKYGEHQRSISWAGIRRGVH